MSFNKPIWWARDAVGILRQSGCTEHADAVLAVCERHAQLEAELAEARQGNDELDGTDAAHPAWWRGNDAGVSQVCAKINAILDGADTFGTAAEPWESTRRRMAEARKHAEQYRHNWLALQEATGEHCQQRALEVIREARKDSERLDKVRRVLAAYQGSALGCNPQILFAAVSDAARGTK